MRSCLPASSMLLSAMHEVAWSHTSRVSNPACVGPVSWVVWQHGVASAMVRNSMKPNLPSEPIIESMTGSPSLDESCRFADVMAALKNCFSISAVSPAPNGRFPTCTRLARRVRPRLLFARLPSALTPAAAAPLAAARGTAAADIAARAAPERPETDPPGGIPDAVSAAETAGLPTADSCAPCRPSSEAVEVGTVDEVTTEETDCGMSTLSRPGGGGM
mmetsp:Transcript_7804/g.25733  ORF Transcript_7804/g.25733 Transcript_7804/m.25733 type:complete len:218 (+) Transcript_7804:679-1332(+)